jgi:hypothetical protein
MDWILLEGCNGRSVRVLHDIWFCDQSLASLFWGIFIICNESYATFADVIVGDELDLSFRQCFDDPMMKRWQMLYETKFLISLSNEVLIVPSCILTQVGYT